MRYRMIFLEQGHSVMSGLLLFKVGETENTA